MYKQINLFFPCLTIALLAACGGPEPEVVSSLPQSSADARFLDVTQEIGLGAFRHVSGAFGEKWFPETMGSGLAVVDYDNDGWQDLMIAAGGGWPESDLPPMTGVRLFRNDGGVLEDVTTETLPQIDVYTFGLTVADYDNDDDADVFVTTLDRNLLLRNDDGVFHEVGAEAGLAGTSSWSTAAVFFDANLDGWLDLFVGNYVEWSPATDLFCSTTGQGKIYCTPEIYEGTPGAFFVNRGDGTFANRTEASGLDLASKSLGAVETDFNGDGLPDLFVANDTDPDQLFVNKGGGSFEDVGPEAGVAYDERGRARAGMGVDAGVTEPSAPLTLFVGNFSDEMVGVYRYLDNGVFLDRAAASKIGRPSLPTLAFGLVLGDMDLDGDLDLFVANGHVQVDIESIRDNTTYRQPPHLFMNEGDGTFLDRAQEAGLTETLVARGAVTLDYDRDGDLDIAVSQNDGGVRIWRNDTSPDAASIRVRVRGANSNRAGIGAVVTLHTATGVHSRRIVAGSSYLSTTEQVATFGLGRTPEKPDSLVVVWPSGGRTVLRDVPSRGVLLVHEDGGVETLSR